MWVAAFQWNPKNSAHAEGEKPFYQRDAMCMDNHHTVQSENPPSQEAQSDTRERNEAS